jgi:hypothetical protein
MNKNLDQKTRRCFLVVRRHYFFVATVGYIMMYDVQLFSCTLKGRYIL